MNSGFLALEGLYKNSENDSIYRCVGFQVVTDIAYFAPIYRDYKDISIIVTNWDELGAWSLKDVEKDWSIYEQI